MRELVRDDVFVVVDGERVLVLRGDLILGGMTPLSALRYVFVAVVRVCVDCVGLVVSKIVLDEFLISFVIVLTR